jgi:hypothetical protein
VRSSPGCSRTAAGTWCRSPPRRRSIRCARFPALLLGTVAVTALYVGVNAAYLRVLPLDRLRASTRLVADFADATLGGAGTHVVPVLVVLCVRLADHARRLRRGERGHRRRATRVEPTRRCRRPDFVLAELPVYWLWGRAPHKILPATTAPLVDADHADATDRLQAESVAVPCDPRDRLEHSKRLVAWRPARRA